MMGIEVMLDIEAQTLDGKREIQLMSVEWIEAQKTSMMIGEVEQTEEIEMVQIEGIVAMTLKEMMQGTTGMITYETTVMEINKEMTLKGPVEGKNPLLLHSSNQEVEFH
jgi:hypothetical protein